MLLVWQPIVYYLHRTLHGGQAIRCPWGCSNALLFRADRTAPSSSQDPYMADEVKSLRWGERVLCPVVPEFAQIAM